MRYSEITRLNVAEFLWTRKNDPMDVDNGLYVKHNFLLSTSYYRVNLRDPSGKNCFALIKQFSEAVSNFPLRKPNVDEYDLFLGGYNSDGISILHDHQMEHPDGISFHISYPLVLITHQNNLIKSDRDFPAPNLFKFISGAAKISHSEVQRRTAIGDWIVFDAPGQYAFGKGGTDLARLAYNNKTPKVLDKSDSWPVRVRYLVWLLKWYRDSFFRVQIANLRVRARYLCERRGLDLGDDDLESLLDLYISYRGRSADDFVREVKRLLTEELKGQSELSNHAKIFAFTRNAFKVPLSRLNREFGESLKNIGVDRRAVDNSLVSLAMARRGKNSSNSTSDAALQREIEREFDTIYSITTKSGRAGRKR